jgi:DNA polymerase III subunit delta'
MAPLPATILGHQKQQAMLLSDIVHDNVAHAYLFTGPKHIGKSTVARWFAAELLATQKGADKETIRTQVERLIHPDFVSLDALWVEGVLEDWSEIGNYSNIQQRHRSKPPTAKTDAIGIDDVRGVIEQMHGTSQSPFRCCLITDIERMHTEAANALLKILEEPPPRVVFLLTSADSRAVLPTILSRTRSLTFSKLDNEILAPLIADMDEDNATLLLQLSRGAPGVLLRYKENTELLRHAKTVHARARSFWKTDSVRERLSLCMPAQESREASEEFLMHLGLTLSDLDSIAERARHTAHYTMLSQALQTNTNRGLALSVFTLAVSEKTW